MNIHNNHFDSAQPAIYYSPDDGGGSGSGGDGEQPSPRQPEERGVDLAVSSALVDMVSEYGSVDAAAKWLIKRNHSLEKSKNKAEATANQLKTQTVDDATRAELDGYRELGALGELKTRLDGLESKAQRADELEGQARASSVFDALKLPQNALFKSLLRDTEWMIEGEGEARTIQVKGEGDKAVSFEDYVKTRPEIAEALAMLPVEQSVERPAVAFVRGAPINTGGANKSVFDQIRERNAAQGEKGPSFIEQAEQAGMIKK